MNIAQLNESLKHFKVFFKSLKEMLIVNGGGRVVERHKFKIIGGKNFAMQDTNRGKFPFQTVAIHNILH